jgi:teichuronic acid biosynthesis glycosyltransferase TuaC
MPVGPATSTTPHEQHVRRESGCHLRDPILEASRLTRIAIVTPILPVPHDQTRGRFIYETAKALAELAEVRVFLTQARYPSSLAPSDQAKLLVDRDFKLPDLDVEPLYYPALPLLSRLTNGWMASMALRGPVRRFKPDVVIGYWIYPEGAGAIGAARAIGRPVVIGALGTDLNGRTGLNGWLTRRTLHAADRIINVSQDMTRHTVDHYQVPAERIHTIVNGINTKVFYPRTGHAIRSTLGIPLDAPLIVYVGRLIEAKGLRELLHAHAELVQSTPAARLVIIGEGAFKTVLEQLVAELGLQSHVALAGGLLPDQVAQWVSSAQVLTLPSWTEGYPNVLVEALACGCPIVATQVGGIPEIVTPERGILVPIKNAPALSQALARALSQPWDRQAIANGMRRTWSDVARETLTVCNALVEQMRPQR